MTALITLLLHDIYRETPDESGFSGAGADRYKLSLTNLRLQLEAVRAVRSDAPVLVTDLPARMDPSPRFAISADDGGISYYALLAPCLDRYGWRGHCLITTSQLGKPGFLHKHHVRELHEAGHLIGSHTATHPVRFSSCSWNQQVSEWQRSKAHLEDILGVPVTVGSVPGGYYSTQVAKAAAAAGLNILMTSEPQTTLRTVDACQIFGRYTLRHDDDPALAGRLTAQNPGARRQQWLSWNGKKLLKMTLGPGYQRLTGMLSR
jgi:peptidoglycan/xylan/chitin deacetylase (PgdA/CDA1 family)